MAIAKLFILTACASIAAGQAWNQNPTYEPGKFGDICDDSRPCNQARNLVCNRVQPYGTGRCDCRVQQFSTAPWIYNPALQICQDPNMPNLNPHHHYNYNYYPNQPQQQPQPQQPLNPFGSNGNGNGNGDGSWSGSGPGVFGVGSSCVDDRNCEAALGRLSRCTYNRCSCFDIDSQGKSQVGEYEARCWKIAREGEACTDDPQCILGGSDLKCVQDSDNSDLRHCKCEGRGCRNGATSVSSMATITLGLTSAVAAKILL